MSNGANYLTLVMPAITGVLYLIASAAFTWERRYSWGLVYFAYALANVGLILASVERYK